MPDERPTAFEFPCPFPIKVIGKVDEHFEEMVFEVIRAHVPAVQKEWMSVRQSSGGKYLSVTLTFVAQSQHQLDELYRDLGRQPGVVMIL